MYYVRYVVQRALVRAYDTACVRVPHDDGLDALSEVEISTCWPGGALDLFPFLSSFRWDLSGLGVFVRGQCSPPVGYFGHTLEYSDWRRRTLR